MASQILGPATMYFVFEMSQINLIALEGFVYKSWNMLCIRAQTMY